MLDTNKIRDYFDASELKAPIHIVGCGAIGSHVAERLTRMGCENIHLWDFDTVDAHNITNQMFVHADIKSLKVHAVRDMMSEINPDIADLILVHKDGWHGEVLNGYVFLCVDNIDLRREIVLKNQYNPNCIAFFDFRMRLTDAQHYTALREDAAMMKNFIASMNFSHDEAKDATPKSACNIELSVCYTVSAIVSLGIANFVNVCLNKPVKHTVLLDVEQMTLYAFPIE